jgi:DNA invertase Pin-like site-specific DNA recombinase
MGQKINFSEDDCKKIVDMYKSGMSIVKIGNTFGCSRTPIKKVLHQYGITIDNVLRKISKDDYKRIVDLYNSGKTQQEIADLYGCGKHIVYTIMKTMGAQVRSNGFTKDDANQMYVLYKAGNRLPDIAKIYDIDRHTVGRVLKRNGFVTDRKTYHCDEHYFDVVDNGDKAYILGLLWSDGCNSVDIGKITLQLQERDKQILEDISTLVSSDMPLWFLNLNDKNPNWSNTYTLTMRSKHMSDLLASYGMVQRKSLVLKFPEWLSKSLYPHFIRGYMDGDGSIYYSQQNKVLRINMIGTKHFLDVVQNMCLEIDVKTSLYHKDGHNEATYTLYTTSNAGALKFLQWIYNGANLKLQRKYDKYQQALYDYNINNSPAS